MYYWNRGTNETAWELPANTLSPLPSTTPPGMPVFELVYSQDQKGKVQSLSVTKRK
jgi:hypothetical protein